MQDNIESNTKKIESIKKNTTNHEIDSEEEGIQEYNEEDENLLSSINTWRSDKIDKKARKAFEQSAIKLTAAGIFTLFCFILGVCQVTASAKILNEDKESQQVVQNNKILLSNPTAGMVLGFSELLVSFIALYFVFKKVKKLTKDFTNRKIHKHFEKQQQIKDTLLTDVIQIVSQKVIKSKIRSGDIQNEISNNNVILSKKTVKSISEEVAKILDKGGYQLLIKENNNNNEIFKTDSFNMPNDCLSNTQNDNQQQINIINTESFQSPKDLSENEVKINKQFNVVKNDKQETADFQEMKSIINKQAKTIQELQKQMQDMQANMQKTVLDIIQSKVSIVHKNPNLKKESDDLMDKDKKESQASSKSLHPGKMYSVNDLWNLKYKLPKNRGKMTFNEILNNRKITKSQIKELEKTNNKTSIDNKIPSEEKINVPDQKLNSVLNSDFTKKNKNIESESELGSVLNSDFKISKSESNSGEKSNISSINRLNLRDVQENQHNSNKYPKTIFNCNKPGYFLQTLKKEIVAEKKADSSSDSDKIPQNQNMGQKK